MKNVSRTAAWLGAAISAIPMLFASSIAVAGGTWSARNDMPVPLAGAGSAVVDGTVYLVGGFFTNSTCNSVATVWAYDPVSQGLTPRAPLPNPRTGIAVVAAGGRIYAFGGFQTCGEIETDEALVYDPSTDHWSPIAPVPAPPGTTGVGNMLPIAVDGTIYLVGGVTGNPNLELGRVISYDTATNEYTTHTPMPLVRNGASIAEKDGRIYLFGGQPAFDDVQVYDTAADTWSVAAPMPLGNCCTGAVLLDSRIWSFGGNRVGGEGFSYDPNADTWRAEPSMPLPRGNDATVVVDGLIYALGGQSFPGLQATPTVQVFTLEGANHPPVANAGADQSIAAGASCTAQAALDGSASSDPDGDSLSFAWTGSFGTAVDAQPTVTLGLGTHTVSLEVNDGHGGTASDDVQVTVSDGSAPSIASASASPATLWPPNHRMVDVSIAIGASDNCGAAHCRIVGVSSNESANGAGDGNTSPDWVVSGDLSLQLRAERSGDGTGRVYTIVLQCEDAAGNAATRTVEVSVPHSAP